MLDLRKALHFPTIISIALITGVTVQSELNRNLRNTDLLTFAGSQLPRQFWSHSWSVRRCSAKRIAGPANERSHSSSKVYPREAGKLSWRVSISSRLVDYTTQAEVLLDVCRNTANISKSVLYMVPLIEHSRCRTRDCNAAILEGSTRKADGPETAGVRWMNPSRGPSQSVSLLPPLLSFFHSPPLLSPA